MILQNYYQTARENETIFRNILRDLRDNREKRPMGSYVPQDLDTESNLEDIFKKYSEGSRMGRFTILNFKKPNKDSVIISFQDTALLSGGGAELEYKIEQDNSIKYQEEISIWMS